MYTFYTFYDCKSWHIPYNDTLTDLIKLCVIDFTIFAFFKTFLLYFIFGFKKLAVDIRHESQRVIQDKSRRQTRRFLL